MLQSKRKWKDCPLSISIGSDFEPKSQERPQQAFVPTMRARVLVSLKRVMGISCPLLEWDAPRAAPSSINIETVPGWLGQAKTNAMAPIAAPIPRLSFFAILIFRLDIFPEKNSLYHIKDTCRNAGTLGEPTGRQPLLSRKSKPVPG